MAGFVTSAISKLKHSFNPEKRAEIEEKGLTTYCVEFIRDKDILTSNDILAFEWIGEFNLYQDHNTNKPMIRINENVTRKDAKNVNLLEVETEDEEIITLTVYWLLSNYLCQDKSEPVFVNNIKPVKKHETHVWVKRGHQINLPHMFNSRGWCERVWSMEWDEVNWLDFRIEGLDGALNVEKHGIACTTL